MRLDFNSVYCIEKQLTMPVLRCAVLCCDITKLHQTEPDRAGRGSGELVGAGSFGQVFGGILTQSGRRIAVKVGWVEAPPDSCSLCYAVLYCDK